MTVFPQTDQAASCGEFKSVTVKPLPLPEFEDGFYDAGHCYAECCCGRWHFGDRGHWTWEDGEYENLQARTRDNADQYVYHPGDDGVRSMPLPSGAIYVEGCACNAGGELGTFLWKNARRVMGLFRTRAGAVALHPEGEAAVALSREDKILIEAILAAGAHNDLADESEG